MNSHFILEKNRFLILASLIIPIFLISGITPAVAYRLKYRTIAHEVLRLETGLGVAPNYRLLDDIIEAARQRISVKSFYAENGATDALKAIDDILLKKNFLYDGRIRLLSEALTPRRLDARTIQYIRASDPNRSGLDFRKPSNLKRIILASERHKRHALSHLSEAFLFGECKTFSFIYLGIADALKLPVSMVLAPSHVFVRWHFSRGGNRAYLNWETTTGVTLDDNFIKFSHNISESSIRSGVYLRSLSPGESMATAYYMLSHFVSSLNRKIVYLTKAVELNPRHNRAFYNRGTLRYKQGKFRKALADYDRAVRLDPNHSESYNNRGNVWYATGHSDKALNDYNKAIELNPKHSRAYNNRGNVWYQKGRLRKALSNYNSAVTLDPAYSGAYNNRGNVWYEMGEISKALADYDKAIALDPKNRDAYKNRAEILRRLK